MNGTTAPERRLGLPSATALVVAAMIGTGVFTTSGFLLADLKSRELVLLAWAAGGVVAALGAASYGALARRIPESGGEYVFLAHTLHPAAGYLAGWVSCLVGFAAPLAAGALAFGVYLKPWLPALPPRVAATLLLAVAAAVQASSATRAARAHNLVVLAQGIFIVVFVVAGLARLPTIVVAAAVPPSGAALGGFPIGALGVSLVWVSYSYAGWNTAVYVASEIKDPERTLPRAMLLGTGIVTALYLLLNTVFLYAVPTAALAGQLDVGRIAAQALGGPAWGAAMSAMVILVLIPFVSSMTMAGPRVVARMAADGYLPAQLAAHTGGLPRAAIGFQLVLSVVMVWTAAYQNLLTYIGFTLGLSNAATVIGLLRLRRREGAALPVLGWPVVPVLFLLFSASATGFTIWRRPVESAVGLATLCAGFVPYLMQRRRGRRAVP